MSRVMVITRIAEQGPMQGDRNRLQGLLSALRILGHEVDVVHLGEDCRAKHAVFLGWSPYLWRPHYRLSTDWVDGVVAFQLSAAPTALRVSARWRILDLTDSLDWYRHHLGWHRSTVGKQFTLAGIGREEVRLARRFDQVFISAKPDEEWLSQRGLTPCVVPNGVNRKMALAPGDIRHLLMVANFLYLPNRLGIERFFKETWPELSRNHYRLTLVGVGSDVLDLPFGVEGVGFQEDLTPWYEKCGVAISPVTLGAGSQNKILEAMAMRRPVLAHRAGLRGLEGEELRAVIALDSHPDGWIAALDRLQDHDYCRGVAEAGYEAVKLFRDQFLDGLARGPASAK